MTQDQGGLFGWPVELAEAAAAHQIELDQAGERQRACDGGLGFLGHAQQQECDQGGGDLGSHGVLGDAEEAGDLERLLDPAEEQLDIPYKKPLIS